MKFTFNIISFSLVTLIFLYLFIFGILIFKICVLILYLIIITIGLKSIEIYKNDLKIVRHLYLWNKTKYMSFDNVIEVRIGDSLKSWGTSVAFITKNGSYKFHIPSLKEEKKLIEYLHLKKFYMTLDSTHNGKYFKR